MAPHVTSADRDAWLRLVELVEKSVQRPARATVELEGAVRAANKAVMPCAPWSPANPYLALLHEARRFAGLMGVDRAGAAGVLGVALDAALEHHPIAAPRGASQPVADPPARFRADIDG